MAIALTTPVTGGPQTGLTSPTYTVALDTAPSNSGKQYAVTALGGTQAGVTVHSPANPFTITIVKPPIWKMAPVPNPTTGMVKEAPKNKIKILVRKGAPVITGTSPQLMIANLEIAVPAGAETVSPQEVRAALSLLFGAAYTQLSAGVGDLAVTGIM